MSFLFFRLEDFAEDFAANIGVACRVIAITPWRWNDGHTNRSQRAAWHPRRHRRAAQLDTRSIVRMTGAPSEYFSSISNSVRPLPYSVVE